MDVMFRILKAQLLDKLGNLQANLLILFTKFSG
jgi:hypothetical protein